MTHFYMIYETLTIISWWRKPVCYVKQEGKFYYIQWHIPIISLRILIVVVIIDWEKSRFHAKNHGFRLRFSLKPIPRLIPAIFANCLVIISPGRAQRSHGSHGSGRSDGGSAGYRGGDGGRNAHPNARWSEGGGTMAMGTRWCPTSYKLVYNPINYRCITYKL